MIQNIQNNIIPIAIYVRVSTTRQDKDRQVSDLKAIARNRNYKVLKVISETGSATKRKRAQRPELLQLLELAATGTIQKILVSEISRLGRRPSETLDLIEQITELNVSILAGNMGMETLLENGKRNPAAGLVFTIFAELARIESEFLSDRILSGQKEARRKGVRIGRPFGTQKKPEIYLQENPEVVRLLLAKHTIRATAKLAGCSTPTVQKVKSILKNRLT